MLTVAIQAAATLMGKSLCQQASLQVRREGIQTTTSSAYRGVYIANDVLVVSYLQQQDISCGVVLSSNDKMN